MTLPLETIAAMTTTRTTTPSSSSSSSQGLSSSVRYFTTSKDGDGKNDNDDDESASASTSTGNDEVKPDILSPTMDGGQVVDVVGTDVTSSPVEDTDYSVQDILDSFGDTSYYNPTELPDYTNMTNEELLDNSTIPGWEMIHTPPKQKGSGTDGITNNEIPRGALVGTVVSTKMQKTVNVSVDRYRVHPKYRKRLRYTRKFMAHDESEVANDGDLVMIVPCHRISKHKHFMLREIIRAKGQL